jgi:hypothetical protein
MEYGDAYWIHLAKDGVNTAITFRFLRRLPEFLN